MSETCGFKPKNVFDPPEQYGEFNFGHDSQTNHFHEVFKVSC